MHFLLRLNYPTFLTFVLRPKLPLIVGTPRDLKYRTAAYFSLLLKVFWNLLPSGMLTDVQSYNPERYEYETSASVLGTVSYTVHSVASLFVDGSRIVRLAFLDCTGNTQKTGYRLVVC